MPVIIQACLYFFSVFYICRVYPAGRVDSSHARCAQHVPRRTLRPAARYFMLCIQVKKVNPALEDQSLHCCEDLRVQNKHGLITGGVSASASLVSSLS